MPEHLAFVWDAFWRLSDSRPMGMTPGRIPFGEVRAYAEHLDLEPDLFPDFDRLIVAADQAFIGHVTETRKVNGKRAGP